MNWWIKLDSGMKALLVALSIGGIIVGAVADRFSAVRVNAMAQQQTIDQLADLEEETAYLKRDVETTKAATAASVNGIAQQLEGTTDSQAETARQLGMLTRRINEQAAQAAKLQEAVVGNTRLASRVAEMSDELAALRKEIDPLRSAVRDLTSASKKLRRKMDEEPSR